jgi:hypothetical protein
MKVGKRVVLAVSLAISMSAFADDQTMGSGGRDGGNTMGSGNGVAPAGGLIGSGTLTSDDDGGILGSGGGKEGRGGMLGSGTRVAADDGGGTIGSGTLSSDDDGGLVGSGGGKEEERGGLIGSGTRSDGYFGSGLAIVTDAFGDEYLVISDGVSVLIQALY